MTEIQWLEVCAARLRGVYGFDQATALTVATACLDACGLEEDPSDAADDEMSCWDNDE